MGGGTRFGRWGMWALASAALLGCDPGHLVVIDLRSDLVAGIEVDAAEVTVETHPPRQLTVPIERDAALLDGVRLAEESGLPSGRVLARVRLTLEGEFVAERSVVTELRADQVVTLLITRDCRGVTCDDPQGETCLGGECAPNECFEEEPELCRTECEVDDDCYAAAACVSARCDAGLCVEAPIDDACAADEYCDPDVGCRPLPEVDPCLLEPDATDHLAFGAGTADDPHVLCTAAQLASLGASAGPELARAFRLGQTIDAGGSAPSIGGAGAPFTGTLEGGGFGIGGLGGPLVAVMAAPGVLRDLELDGAIEGGDTGPLALAVADGQGGTIADVYVRGAITSTASSVGLLVGESRLTIDGCIAELTGNVDGASEVGGLVGRQIGGAVRTSYAKTYGDGVAVRSTGSRAGGLIGQASAMVSDSYAELDVRGDSSVGGLIGEAGGSEIERCSATGEVIGTADTGCVYAGGLVGYAAGTVTVRASFATGDASAGGGVVGGLVGWASDGTIEDSYATGDLAAGTVGSGSCSTMPAHSYVGGLLGVSTGADVRRCWASGAASGDGPVRGSLIGLVFDSSPAVVEASFGAGATGVGGEIGGLIGVVDGTENTVTDCYWDATGTGNDVMCGRSPDPECDADNGVDTAANPDYFFVAANAPMSTWDFVGVWREQPGDFPVLAWQ